MEISKKKKSKKSKRTSECTSEAVEGSHSSTHSSTPSLTHPTTTTASSNDKDKDTTIAVCDLIAMTKKRKLEGETETAEQKKSKKRKKKKKVLACHSSSSSSSVDSSECTTTATTTATATASVEKKTVAVVSEEVEPFPYLEEDCCETQSVAYENIANLLDIIAKKLNKTRQDLRIYDPYFCEGAMVKEMNSLGFMDVYNRKEDFYAMQENNMVPEYDVLVTNPPYSGDHVERLLKFCIQSKKPYFLLMPNYCYMKDYYLRLFSKGNPLTNFQFYVTPLKRLLYTTPKGRRQQKSGKFTSPFPTFWYCYFGQEWASLTDNLTYSAKSSSCNISRRVHQLPVEVLADADPRKKKERDKLKRSKNKARKKAKNSV